MPSVAKLEAAFHAYLDEMDRCVAGKSYWSLLHLLLALPDVCGALESPTGEASRAQYEGWCERYLKPRSKLSSAAWYQMRCVVLHQGRTRANKARMTFSFNQPLPTGATVHEVIEDDGTGGQIVRLDVNLLASTMKSALHDWFQALQDDSKMKTVRRYVQANLPFLARVKAVTPAPPYAVAGPLTAGTSTGSLAAITSTSTST